MGEQDRRGILYPALLPTFDRLPAPDELADLVRWFWIPRWDIAPGRTSRQETLPFPASNLVVEPTRVTLSGPTTTRSHRDLRGSGWAVGALLRPAAIAQLVEDPRAVRDLESTFDAPDLHAVVAAAMQTDGDDVLTRATTAYTHWLDRLTAPDDEGELANLMEDTVAGDRSLTRVEHLADSLGGVRTQRAATGAAVRRGAATRDDPPLPTAGGRTTAPRGL